MRKYLSSIPVILLGLNATYILSATNCWGTFESYGFFYSGFFTLIYLVIYYVYSITLKFLRKRPINVNPIITVSLFMILIGILSTVKSSGRNEVPLLEAWNFNQTEIMEIKLYSENAIVVRFGDVEKKCNGVSGNYALKNDTLTILKVKDFRIPVLNDKYIVTRDYLIPVVNKVVEKDPKTYLRIRSKQ